MKVYRITSPQYAKDVSGEGARRFGGRWNSQGINMLYTSSSIALSFLEILVHTDRKYLRKMYSIIELEVDATSGMTFGSSELSANWNAYPMGEETQNLGDQFITKGTHLWISVPSVVVPFEKNYLINPSYKHFKEGVKILNVFEFSPDGRLSY
jgi:RES domain-containing protein